MQECRLGESIYLKIHPRTVASIVTRTKLFARALLFFCCQAESDIRRPFTEVASVSRLHARGFHVVEAFIYLSGDYTARLFSYCLFQSRQLTTISSFATLILASASPSGTIAASLFKSSTAI